MSHDAINNWVEKAKHTEDSGSSNTAPQPTNVQVIKRVAYHNKGGLIMAIAEKIRPALAKMFEGIRDENNMLVQPARVRAIALNVAQSIVNEQDKKTANA